MDKNLFRNELAQMKPYVPGKPVEELKREYGLENVIKLASNENPLGPSLKAINAIRDAASEINIYPDDFGYELKKKLAEKHNMDINNIVLGNGGTEIIKMIAETFINEGDEAIIPATTFGKYAAEISFLGGKVIKVHLDNYQPDLKRMLECINEKTKLIYLCNPNNPTGNIVPKESIESFIRNLPDDVVLVLDEAYYDYAVRNLEYGDSLEVLRNRPNTIILRTFSKIAGIAGVRIGYVITSENIASAMNKVKLTFGVNNLALAAALAALEDQEHLKNTVDLNHKSLAIMENYFDLNELEYIKSDANFIFVNVNKDSKMVYQKLLEKGIIIRGGFLWGWDTWIRISTGTVEQTEKFIKALEEVLTDTK
ncbi:MAG: histidinol-phosphate transaminase [Clostridiaceae bacterium]